LNLAQARQIGKENRMNSYVFTFCGTRCQALPSGALWLPEAGTLCVSDLHLGKSDRIARRSGVMLPPYEGEETLGKLADDIGATDPRQVICLGDSFDDLAAADSLDGAMRLRLTSLQAGRKWVWIEGNHDPGPVDLGGSHLAQIDVGSLSFRHIATSATSEVSGHYHPKHRLAGRSRPAFVVDATRIVMPAYGAYTGGLDCMAPVIRQLFGPRAFARLTGHKALAVPLA
jgi:uncharacterized protein